MQRHPSNREQHMSRAAAEDVISSLLRNRGLAVFPEAFLPADPRGVAFRPIQGVVRIQVQRQV
jgi:hypothetical protein